MHCQMGEHLSFFEPIADIPKLSLPWVEVDFDVGIPHGPPVCLESDGGNGGIYAELVKAVTLW